MEVKICVLVREHHDVTFAENHAAAYTPLFGTWIESLFWQLFFLNFHKLILK